MPNKKNKSQAELDWENRTLCIDENCIGVIGPNGRCKECDLPYEGFEYQTADATAPDAPEESKLEAEAPVEAGSDVDWENRTLCIDESCIGVIGPDGRCKECGKPFEENT